MISIHDVKEILIISGLSLFFLYALKREIRKTFNKKMLCIYQYSIPFFSGIFVTMISFLGFVYSFYYAAQYAPWLLVSTCIGYTLVIYSNGILAKYQDNERKYNEIINIAKNSAKWLIISLLALIFREWFI